MLENQGLLAIAFFEATAYFILLVLFLLLRRDQGTRPFNLWLAGWLCLTLSSFSEFGLLAASIPSLRILRVLLHFGALLLFLESVRQHTLERARSQWPELPLGLAVLLGVWYLERAGAPSLGAIRWETAILESVVYVAAGWLLWRWRQKQAGHGARLLAGAFLLAGLHGVDRVHWPEHPLFLLRVAFDHLLGMALGVAAVVLVLEAARARTEELNDKMRRLTMLTAASTQTLSVDDVLNRVLAELVSSLGASNGIVRLLEGDGEKAQLVARSAVGFSQAYLERNRSVAASEPWAQRVLKQNCMFVRIEEEEDQKERERMAETGVIEIVSVMLPGKKGPLGIIAVGSPEDARFRDDEITYLTNVANLLGLTLQNVRLFEQVATIQRQWAYTFDSISDPILVHDPGFRVLRTNQRLCQLLGREATVVAGRSVTELLLRKEAHYEGCPYCEGVAGEGDDPDPWLRGYFLASNSAFADPAGNQLGTVHVLKDITERKKAEEKYRTLVSNVQEGVFISTPQGRFLDFNDAFMRIAGYERREELMNVEIASTLFETAADRDRLKKLLNQHGAVADFEFEMKRKDGETRSVTESSIAVRDSSGNVTAYQGFVLDITERKRAEQEIRRRNRELLVLNSISQTLAESMDLTDSLNRTLRQLMELFKLDASSLYLFQAGGTSLRRVAAVGHRSEHSQSFQPFEVPRELLQQIKAVHATFITARGLALPPVFMDMQKKEGIVSAYVVILWSKDKVIGGLVVGSRTAREFSAADVNLLIAVGSQISNAIERSLLYEETRQAYDNLRRTQEQLLHSEKMAAVGQLISGVAHELNNPLTAILGYSQLLTSSGQIGPQGLDYTDKLYKQAQRTHRIVQNLLSFARQHKPERMPVSLNEVLEDALALRDYDLRLNNIRVHLDLAPDLPLTAADPHQFQQVFLNLVNNAVDAILEKSKEGDLWVRTGARDQVVFVEFADSGPGVHDASKVFDPFYTTKPVGKGTGLGLSICYGIVTEHGGTIRVKNDAPRGAVFSIELPLQAVALLERPGKGGSASLSRTGRVLLVDPDESVLDVAGVILRGERHRVQTARSAQEAKDFMERQSFDVIVADLHVLKNGSGGGLERWLDEKHPGLAGRLVFMRSGAPVESSGVESSGGRPMLQKPFKAADLLAAVSASLGQVPAVPI